MGMYTALGVDCVIRPQYVEPCGWFLGAYRNEENRDPRWIQWHQGVVGWRICAEALPDDDPLKPALLRYSRLEHADAICRGAQHLMDWDEFRHFDPETRRWTVAVALKNYHGELEIFVGQILPRLAEKVLLCQSQYEESSAVTDWSFESGRIDQRSVAGLNRLFME